MRVTGSSSKPHEHQPKHCTAAHLYRPMKFLPKPKVETPLERFTGVGTLEAYIDNTKQMLADNLPTLCSNHPPNLTALQQNALTKHKSTRQTLTIKPADKNLGIVLMNTEDYISQCLLHLTDQKTYRTTPSYPKDNIQRELHNLIITFKEQLHKRLETYLSEGPQHPRIPQFYGIPKMHKKFQHLPPMRPIVSQSSSLLSPSTQFIDHVLQPLANIYPDYIPNSTALILRLQDLVVPDDAILVTVDVTNLYPSIPQSECLNIIHTEMHKHSHLFTFDPNFITRLLHININYNYFNFGNHTFQQVRGTAMGAAFSPTIANIFLSTIIRSFLLTQPIHPLAIARYIDDIFIIWTNTTETLTTFLNNLNSFHPNLCFTHEHSTTSVDFLDLTIYKGPDFPITNILDLKTFQKPRNLYQYLHYKSSHQNQVFKSIIRGECIRYTRTNTTEATYRAMIYMFKQRLLKRGYPETLVNRVIHTVNYSDRQKYIQKHQKHQPTCSPPLLKCIPPPQYQLLKKIILKDYAQLKFISPRFIALRPHTLQSILVRAKLTPTDEQHIDISLALEAPTMQHMESAKLPKPSYSQPLVTACRHSHCVTCRYHLPHFTQHTHETVLSTESDTHYHANLAMLYI